MEVASAQAGASVPMLGAHNIMHLIRFARRWRLSLASWKDSIAIHIQIPYNVYTQLEVIPMGRTNVVLDDGLVEECKKLTGITTRRALIDYALHELRRHGRQRRLLELKGTIEWEGNLDAWREGRA